MQMVDNRTNNAKAIITSLRSTVGENIRVFDTEIPFSVRAAECSLSGESIFSHDKNGKVAAAYHREQYALDEKSKELLRKLYSLIDLIEPCGDDDKHILWLREERGTMRYFLPKP